MPPRIHPLLRYLKARKISYRAAARELDCHFTYVGQICSRLKTPSPRVAKRIEAWTKGAVTLGDLYK